ncbi:MAG: hypothetical protein K5860_03645 [Bacteroidales bacterium]|nr:hypothetical protein [Bacteroidales bacterium]
MLVFVAVGRIANPPELMPRPPVRQFGWICNPAAMNQFVWRSDYKSDRTKLQIRPNNPAPMNLRI